MDGKTPHEEDIAAQAAAMTPGQRLREEWARELEAAAAWLRATDVTVTWFAQTEIFGFAASEAEVDQAAAALGVTPQRSADGHYRAMVPFGRHLAYMFVHVPAKPEAAAA